jgi:pimeloyl-ACP methyl ester carboxylesterase
MIMKTDYRIVSETEGCNLLLRHKCLSGSKTTKTKNTVLFVHGATYGSTMTYDYPIDGCSWMDDMTSRGFDTWCIDLLGYGGSDRPKAMYESAELNKPLVDTAQAVADVDRAIEFIFQQQNINSLSLIGYSWGSAVCGAYAGIFGEKIHRLVLSGALWVEKGTSAGVIPPVTGAYRTLNANDAMKRWATGLTTTEFRALVPESRVRQWCDDVVRSDPTAGDNEQGVLKAPTGVMKDFIHCTTTGTHWYDPSLITAPTQIVVGELDKETTPEQSRAVFSRLTSAAEKRLTTIGAGTHSLLLENNRHSLYKVVAEFLNEQ